MSSFDWFHTATFYVLYGAAALATFVIIERIIFYMRTAGAARRLAAAYETASVGAARTPPHDLLARDSVPSRLVNRMLAARPGLTTRHQVEDTADALYIDAKAHLSRHLWVLDTIVTAAPLLGLLGTIFGIIDTFKTLAQSGISDPAGVSAGIGTALYATALGISVAVYGLVFHNAFHERVTRITDYVKILLIKAGAEGPALQD